MPPYPTISSCELHLPTKGINVKPIKIVTILLTLAVPLSALGVAHAADAGLLTIKALGTLNGQALACSEVQAAARAKSLMLVHAPKTPRFGAAYEEATQAAYLEQTRSSGACPDATRLTDQLNQLALRLAATLPVIAAESK